MSREVRVLLPDVRSVRRLMFVCLGNICRSPLAEGVFAHEAVRRGVRDQLSIASCGTGGWHVGSEPDSRSMSIAMRHGVRLASHAQKFCAAHFSEHDLFVAMDRSNVTNLIRAGCPPSRVVLLLQFVPRDELLAKHPAAALSLEVPDPYHGGDAEFEEVYSMVYLGALGLLNAIYAPE